MGEQENILNGNLLQHFVICKVRSIT